MGSTWGLWVYKIHSKWFVNGEGLSRSYIKYRSYIHENTSRQPEWCGNHMSGGFSATLPDSGSSESAGWLHRRWVTVRKQYCRSVLHWPQLRCLWCWCQYRRVSVKGTEKVINDIGATEWETINVRRLITECTKPPTNDNTRSMKHTLCLMITK